MKKLMIAAAIVCAAAYTQASSFSWGNSSMDSLDPSGAYIEGGTITLIVAGDTIFSGIGQNDDWTYGQFEQSASSDKIAALADGDISESYTAKAFQLVFNYTDSDGKDWVYTYSGMSTYDNVAGAPGDPAKNYENFTIDYAIDSTDWKAVPEPTSGLLLLIGVAGLALRRRRA